jgi:hypothetical protein
VIKPRRIMIPRSNRFMPGRPLCTALSEKP